MSNLQKWGSYDLKAAKEEAEELAKSGSSNFFKPRSGENRLRFCPPKLGTRSPFVLVHQHFVKLPGMAKAVSFNCPRVMAKRSCYVCQRADQLRSSGNQADYETAGEYMAKLRVFANVVDRAAPEMGAQVFGYGKQIHETLIQLREAEDGGDFTHPIEGFDVIVTKTGQNVDTRYTVRAARNESPLGDMAYIDQVIEAMPDINRYARVLSDEDIGKLLGLKGAARAEVTGTVVESRKANINTKLDEPDV